MKLPLTTPATQGASPPAPRPPSTRTTTQMNVRIPAETRAILDFILERDGVPYGAQITRAMRVWAESKGIDVARLLNQQDPVL